MDQIVLLVGILLFGAFIGFVSFWLLTKLDKWAQKRTYTQNAKVVDYISIHTHKGKTVLLLWSDHGVSWIDEEPDDNPVH